MFSFLFTRNSTEEKLVTDFANSYLIIYFKFRKKIQLYSGNTNDVMK